MGEPFLSSDTGGAEQGVCAGKRGRADCSGTIHATPHWFLGDDDVHWLHLRLGLSLLSAQFMVLYFNVSGELLYCEVVDGKRSIVLAHQR